MLHNNQPNQRPTRAIVVEQYGGPEQLVLKQLPEPQPAPGQVIVENGKIVVAH